MGSRVYFAPFCADVVGVYDAAANEGQGEFDVISLEGKVRGDFKFKGAAVVGDKVYFCSF